MDPITAIGLTAAVVQLLDFSIKAAKTVKEVRDRGSSTDVEDTDHVASHLSSLSESVKSSLQLSSIHRSLSGEEKELLEISNKCQECSRKLQEQLNKLKLNDDAKTSDRLKVVARTLFKKDSIATMQEKLDGFRRVLESRLLLRLSQRWDVESLRTSDRFEELNDAAEHLVACLSDSETSLTKLVQYEALETRQHVTQEIERLRQIQLNDKFYQDVKDSLFFSEISYRQEQIEHEFDGFEDSNDWIFEGSSLGDSPLEHPSKRSTAPKWDNFSDWLRSGSGVYWINGKAGSGKSTLMNFLYSHLRTNGLLRDWAGRRKLLTPAFFFWNSGSVLQRSVQGLLRSLIYQIIEVCPELASCVKNPQFTWTEQRLLDTLSSLLTQILLPVAICMFIDGLDEFDGSYSSIINILHRLDSQTNTKVCLSSRPLHEFETAFNAKPSLRLQELSFGSIKRYTKTKLLNSLQNQSFYDEYDQQKILNWAEEITWRSEGVFLWAVLAVRGLCQGLIDFADLSDLTKQVDDLPQGIESLYSQMLKRIKPAYRRNAIKYLQMALFALDDDLDLSLSHFYLIDNETVTEDCPLIPDSQQLPNLESCQNMKIRLLSHTLGLLDIVPNTGPSVAQSGINDKVQFFHRTAVDFLRHENSQSALMNESITERHFQLSYSRGIIAHLMYISSGAITTSPGRDHKRHLAAVEDDLGAAMSRISSIERDAQVAQSCLLKSLHQYLVYADARFFRSIGDLLRRKGWGFLFPVDLVGLAAQFNMPVFVFRVIGKPFSRDPSCDRCREGYKRYDAIVHHKIDNFWWDLEEDVQRLHDQDRAWLKKRLKWGNTSPTTGQMTTCDCDDILPETYILGRLSIRRILSRDWVETEESKTEAQLMKALLCAGANPMLQMSFIQSANARLGGAEITPFQSCFWHHWLLKMLLVRVQWGHEIFLKEMTIYYWDLTKSLLTHGANLDYEIQDKGSTISRRYVALDFDFKINTCDVLDMIFGDFLEWRDIIGNCVSSFSQPKRRIISIFPRSLTPRPSKFSRGKRTYLSDEESERLWQIIEVKGEVDEAYEVYKEMKRIFLAHNPDLSA
ncbi:uncharacterized protein KY384_002322 [Bacidia gigantensis]|uniref:uncharacterized protein n=1 Tax=Bacidia gigantensis TaxID=2732470 RepID=UPI001D053AE1|nr:uncharacterized protein KY384_002322 [Bacidia gigantensis]KAG8532445.1 hypothetical protein KY384_002322 [Bacidia gigantensis]